MKKIISFILAAATAVSMIPAATAAYTDVDASADYCMSALRLQDLGIISGYADGSFCPDNSITREEFTKIVVCMMDKETEAKAQASFSGFYDVAAGKWSAPYINYAVQKEILSGYSDGSFGPDRTISMAEAVTILLRSLGYTEEYVGYFWPNNYMDAAASLGITEGMYCSADAPLTRATAAILTDRTLFTKPAQGVSQTADTYIETLGYTVLDDALILDKDDSSDNISILAGNLKLNNASTYIGKTQMEIETGDMFDYAVIDKNGYLATVKDYGKVKGMYSETVVVNRISGNTLEYTTLGGSKGTYKADDSFVTYYDNSKMTFASAKSNIEIGTDVTFYGSNDGIWNIAVIGTSNDVDPVLATRSYTDSASDFEGVTIDRTNLIVYRDGEAASIGDIEKNDVVYYNTKTNTMDVYSEKITGIYYSASPSKAYAESVTVGGKSYEIGYASARNRLDASPGAFNIGDKVTLLLGKDDKIAFAIDNSGSLDYYEYGVLLSCTTRIADSGVNDGSTEYIATMFMAGGEVQEVVTDKLYKSYIGDFMKVNYANGKATLARINEKDTSAYAGDVNIDDRTIGGRYVLKDAAIIQRVSDDDAAVAECELLDFDTLTVNKIDKSQIINTVTANAFGDIAIMYVKNLENTYTYGVITGFEKGREEGNEVTNGYKIFSKGTAGSYMLGSAAKISTSVGAGVGYRLSNGSISKIVPLVKLASAGGVGAVEGSRVMLDGKIYKMAAEVEIIDITNITTSSNIRSITINELKTLKGIDQVTLYSDKSEDNGGIVRLITVKTK